MNKILYFGKTIKDIQNLVGRDIIKLSSSKEINIKITKPISFSDVQDLYEYLLLYDEVKPGLCSNE